MNDENNIIEVKLSFTFKLPNEPGKIITSKMEIMPQEMALFMNSPDYKKEIFSNMAKQIYYSIEKTNLE